MKGKQTMKRHDIENHSRAAFYLAARAEGYRASDAWRVAARRESFYHAKAEASRAAGDALAAMWESLGKVEPKRYSPEGQALTAARDAAAKANKESTAAGAYRGDAAARPYVGTWQPSKRGHFYAESPESLFRGVWRAHEVAPRAIDHHGYYDNPYGDSSRDGSGLVFGMVAQLPGRDGQARYVAGYCYGGSDRGGATFNMAEIFTAAGDDSESAMRDAALRGDQWAEAAAEDEKAYQAASNSGARWAELGEEIAACRKAALELLAERRAAKGRAGANHPAICRAISDSVAGFRRDIAEARKERAELAAGESDLLWWQWGRHDESGLEAFAESAGLTMAEARGIFS